MYNIILFDGPSRNDLKPFTFTRPVADLRVGILKIAEKWSRLLNAMCSFDTQEYLSEKFKQNFTEKNHFVDGAILPDKQIAQAIGELKPGEALQKSERLLAVCLTRQQAAQFCYNNTLGYTSKQFDKEVSFVNDTWDIFTKNEEEIKKDFALITSGRESASLSATVNVLEPGNVFVEEGVNAEYCTINASQGPVYLGKNSEIMEGAVIRGPFAIGEHSTVKLNAKIYGPVTLGPHVKVGGEVSDSVFFGYANKAHDGFLGDAVIGEWCNLGADTNNSNLKNNYAEVRLWNYTQERFKKTGLQFCGLMMGDHSKCGINTMFNTGTVIGVSANIFGSGFPRNFVPSFSWGGANGFTDYSLNKVYDVATKVMGRRGVSFDETEKAILQHIYDETKKYRKF